MGLGSAPAVAMNLAGAGLCSEPATGVLCSARDPSTRSASQTHANGPFVGPDMGVGFHGPFALSSRPTPMLGLLPNTNLMTTKARRRGSMSMAEPRKLKFTVSSG